MTKHHAPVVIPAWLTRFLDGHHARYRILFHTPTRDALETAEVEHVTDNWSAKVVVMTDHRGPVMLAMPAYATADVARIRTLTGRGALQAATKAQLARLFPHVDCDVLPPLPIWPSVELWMDPTLEHDGPLLFPAGTHRASVKMDFTDWKRLARPVVAPFIEPTFIGA